MISIICPVYNESKHIRNVLHFCVNANPPDKEIFFIDGNSTDDTCAVITEYAKQYNRIQLLHNPARYVASALNLAIQKAKGDIIVRLDAHTEYAPDYFEKIIAAFDNMEADIVGGPMRIAQGNAVQAAIGYATCTFFGIGNSSFHFEEFEGFTQSVYLGAWRKSIFTQTGLFDEKFIRNQDDEFHYRAKSMGYKIYQSPDIRLYYHPRSTLQKLFKQYFQYGYYKPMVLRKIGSAFSWRHLAPGLFMVYLCSLPLLMAAGFYIAALPLAVYLLFMIFYAAAARKSIVQTGRIALVYSIIHVAYGSGFIAGAVKLLFKKQPPVLPAKNMLVQ